MPPFIVQYLCSAHPTWRDAFETDDWTSAVTHCYTIRVSRQRPTRIIDFKDQEVFRLP
jgi:hypothetical protein